MTSEGRYTLRSLCIMSMTNFTKKDHIFCYCFLIPIKMRGIHFYNVIYNFSTKQYLRFLIYVSALRTIPPSWCGIIWHHHVVRLQMRKVHAETNGWKNAGGTVCPGVISFGWQVGFEVLETWRATCFGNIFLYKKNIC